MHRAVQFLAIAALVAVVALTVVPAAERPVTGLGQDWEHFPCFAIVGALTAVAFELPLSCCCRRPCCSHLACSNSPGFRCRRGMRGWKLVVDALRIAFGVLCARLSTRRLQHLAPAAAVLSTCA